LKAIKRRKTGGPADVHPPFAGLPQKADKIDVLAAFEKCRRGEKARRRGRASMSPACRRSAGANWRPTRSPRGNSTYHNIGVRTFQHSFFQEMTDSIRCIL